MTSSPSDGHYAYHQRDAPTALSRAKEFVELHDQVQTSVNLLNSLESFLSTFQNDLSAVSGQISELQDRSKDIESRLKSRRKIEKPLASLLSDISIPPALATLILDTDVGEPWIEAIGDFERRLDMAKGRMRVKAARDVAEVAEGLRIVAATKLRGFFLALLQPIRASITTNMQVVQTSVLLKYKPLFAFLQNYAPNVAQEVQRAYSGAARTYYETGFRRYIRSLGWIKARSPEKPDSIIAAPTPGEISVVDLERLAHARLDGPSVTLAYMGDDKTHKEPIEALLRSILLVLMDNATAEYTFVTAFFAASARPAPPSPPAFPMSPLLSPGGFDDSPRSPGLASDASLLTPRPPFSGLFAATETVDERDAPVKPDTFKAERAALDATWKQILEPVLEYTQAFIAGILDPPPAVVPLLTMIRLAEAVVGEVQQRGCGPLEPFVFGLRLQMWPVFQRAMTVHVDALRRLADGAGAGAAAFFGRGTQTTDAQVNAVCQRYMTIFGAMVALTEQEEETMIFSNLLRLRQELSKLITKHTDKISDPVTKATTQSNLYEVLLQGLSRGPRPTTHPKAQTEIAFWREREQEARRRIRQSHR